MNVFDTIAAVSTPRGKGGIAVIRISGLEALAIGERVFRPKNKKSLLDLESNRQVWGDIFAPDVDGGVINIDDGMGVVFRAPHSFTGEDTVEISCHGGVLITEAVLEAVMAAGARPAMAGEFTRRAFVSGRMTLTQAEALGGLLEAKNHRQMILSRTGVSGVLSKKIESLYSQMTDVLSSIYAKIDFPDEDLGDMGRDEIEETLVKIREEESKLASTYKMGKAVGEGVRTVICGRTNAGKSSLYNLLSGEDAAIVTSIPGTTRDLLERTMPLGRVMLRLTDTAGIRERDDMDEVERIGIQKSRDMIAKSELLFALFDLSRPFDEEDELILESIKSTNAPKIALLNKADLDERFDGSKICGFDSVIKISTKEGEAEAISALSAEVNRLFTDEKIVIGRDAIISSARQHAELSRCLDFVLRAIESMEIGFAQDAASSDIERALGAISRLDGREVSDDVVSDIFSKFCVGK